MDLIKEKIKITKIGILNPAAKRIKMIDTIANESKEFGTVRDCARYLGIKKGETSIRCRLNGSVTSLYRKKYWFEYV